MNRSFLILLALISILLGLVPQRGTPQVSAAVQPAPVHQIVQQSPRAVSDGLTWLAAQQTSSGAWSTSAMGLTLRDTATVLQAFAAHRQQPPAYQLGLSWLAAQQPQTLDLHARRLTALATQNAAAPSELDTLAAAQLSNGAWGDTLRGAQGNPFDTALALRALAEDPAAPRAEATYGLAALRSFRQADGGWMLRPDHTSLHATASIVWSLAPYHRWYTLSTVVDPAVAYILAAQNSDGSFGDGGVVETALSFLALWSVGNQDTTVLDNARNVVVAAQDVNGSWENDPYATALALIALAQREETTLQGIVVDNFNSANVPISDAVITVTLDPSTILTASTNLAGEFALSDIPPGTWTMAISAPGYYAISGPVQVRAGQANNVGSIGLTLIPSEPDFVWNPPALPPGSYYINFTNTTRLARGRTISQYAWRSSNGYTGGNQPTWQAYFGTPGEHAVTLTIVDNFGVTLTKTHLVTVLANEPADPNPNQAPVVTLSQHANGCLEGQSCAMNINVQYNDGSWSSHRRWDWGDGDVDTAYGWDTSHIYAEDGIYNVSLEVITTNGFTGTATTTVTVGNAPPVPSVGADRAVNTGYEIAIPGSATDPSHLDAQALELIWDFGDGTQATPSNLIHNPGSVQGVARHVWDTSGVYTVTLTAQDPDGGIGTDTAVYTVTDKNMPPIITSTPEIFAIEGQPYTYTVQASDPESQPLTYTLTQAPFGMSMDAAGTVTWTPLDLQVGHVPVTVVVSDAAGDYTAQSYQVRVFPRGQRHDLIIQDVTVASTTDAQSLQTSGIVTATIRNLGPVAVTTPFSLTLFDDANQDQTWSEFQDVIVGETTVAATLAPFGSHTVVVPINGLVSFRDNVVYGVVDSTNTVDEGTSEDNNLARSQQPRLNNTTPTVGAGTIAPELKWSFDGVGGDYTSTLVQPTIGPLVDFNQDGFVNEQDVPAIVVVAESYFFASNPQGRQLIILRGDTGEPYCRIGNLPESIKDSETYPQVGDLDGDGIPEIILAGYRYANSQTVNDLFVFNNNCTLRWQREFSQAETLRCQFRHYYTVPFLVDINQDRRTEILVGNHVIDAEGNTIWRVPNRNQLNGTSCFAIAHDIDLDGQIEYIDGAQIVLRHDGTVYWDKEQEANRQFFGRAAVANFDDDPYAEIVFVGYYENGSRLMKLVNHDGSEIWSVPFSNNYETTPVLGDFNLDGVPDIAITANPKSTLNVYDGSDGSLIWSRYFPTNTGATTTPFAFDLNGDGILELTYRSESHALILNSLDGSTIWQEAHRSSTGFEYLMVADLDLDGHAEVLSTGSGAYYFQGMIQVYADRYNSWGPARSVNNQFDYSVTNVNDDGSIPQYQQPNWLRHNNYRVQVAPEGSDGSAPDLTASFIRTTAEACPDTQQVMVRVGNGGGRAAPKGWSVALYHGTPSATTFIAAVVISQTLQPGEYLDVTIPWDAPPAGEQTLTVVANATVMGDLVREDQRANNAHSQTIITCDGSNQPPVITSIQPTTAGATQVYTPTITATDADGDPLRFTLLEAPINATIHRVDGSIYWLPSYADEGAHTFSVAVTDGRGGRAVDTWTVAVVLPEPIDPGADSCVGGTPGAIEIPGNGIDDDCNPATPDSIPNGAVAASITTNKAAYGSNELARITSVINHTAAAGTFMGLVATVQVRDAGGTVLYEKVHTVLPLAPGGAQTLTDVFPTGTLAPGTLTAEVVVSANTQLDQASTPFDLRASSETGTALSGTLTLVPSVVASGANFNLAWSATNVGNSNLTDVTFTLFVIDPATDQVVQQRSITTDVAQGATIDRTTAFQNVVFSGQALVVLQATTNTIDQPLDNAGLRFEGILVTQGEIFLPIVRK